MRPRLPPLVGALVIIAAFAAVTVALLRIADGRDADRAAQPAPDDEGPAIELSGAGIGAFPFGADPDPVIAGLTLRWGPPDGDTGWVAAGSSPRGSCPGTVVRGVNWRGLTVLFTDGATPWHAAGARHLFRWEFQFDDPPRPGPEVRVDPAVPRTSGAVLAGGGTCGS